MKFTVPEEQCRMELQPSTYNYCLRILCTFKIKIDKRICLLDTSIFLNMDRQSFSGN